VSSQTSLLLVLQPAGRTRSRLIRRAKTLSLLSIGWMTVEAGVAIVAALIAGSVALLGFGLDSLIELASAGTILWLYTDSRSGSDAAERRAQQGRLDGARPADGRHRQQPTDPALLRP
jgi:hypothetical protein